MALITLSNVDVSIGGSRALLEHVDLAVDARERVCLIGRNGAGKSTLLRLLAGEIEPDDGTVRVQRGTRIARLTQEVPAGTAGTVFDVVAGAVGHLGDLLAEFHRLAQSAGVTGDVEALGRVQARIDAEGGWDVDRRVNEVVSRLDLDPDIEFATLSGGMKRRVLLARALAGSPDVLLLDEPTNHLDLANIEWLESFLEGFAGSLVFVTHDRRFLRALATRIVEIDRGTVSSWPGDYENYLRRREERLNAEAREQERFDRRLAREEAWIRQGIKARRTRNEGRVRALQDMRRERARRREADGTVRMEAAAARSSGRRVIEAEGAGFAYNDQPIVAGLNVTVLRGDRIGIVGPNGSGKTTLIRLLLGELAPRSGTVRTGTSLRVAYFDQHRAVLDETATALDNVAGGREFVEINGRQRHAISYLQDFLFTPARARAPITALSGGERNRLLLARLFSQPSNLLVLDEPTNDLDIETLELLEELVADYAGTVLLVSHDREFLDRVVTSVLVLEGGGRVAEYVGGYCDWLARRPGTDVGGASRTTKAAHAKPVRTNRRAGPRGLGSAERRELEQLPDRIEVLESRVAGLARELEDPQLHAGDGARLREINDQLARAQVDVDEAYRRWEALDARASTAEEASPARDGS